MKDKAQARQDFLLKMYEMAWDNITRTDESLWKLFISYVTVIIAAVLLSDKYLHNPLLGLIVALLITAVAICYCFNVNLWFLRNIIIIGNLEASFLNLEDYNRLIPERWHPPYEGKFFSFKEFPTILGFSYLIFAILMYVIYLGKLSSKEIYILTSIFAILMILVYLYIRNLKMRFENIKKEAPGPKGYGKDS